MAIVNPCTQQFQGTVYPDAFTYRTCSGVKTLTWPDYSRSDALDEACGKPDIVMEVPFEDLYKMKNSEDPTKGVQVEIDTLPTSDEPQYINLVGTYPDYPDYSFVLLE